MKYKIAENVLLWVAAVLYLFLGTHIGIIYLDDGAAVFGAWNVLSGKIPYRDFMIIGGPAYFYLLALFFKLIGPYLIVERILNTFILSGISLFVYQITLTLTPRRWAFVALVLSLATLGSYPHYPGGQPSAVLLSLASTWLFLRWTQHKDDSHTLFFCGILTAFSVLFRQDVGISTAVVQTFALFIACRSHLKRYFVGLGVILTIGLTYFLIQVPFERLVFAFWHYPVKVYPQYAKRAIPMHEGTLSDKLMLLMPFVIYPGAFLIWLKQRPRKESFAILYLLAFGLLHWNQARLRPDTWHFLSTWMPCVILAAMIAERIWNKSHFFLYRALLGFAFLIFLFYPLMLKTVILLEGGLASSVLNRAKGIHFLPESYGTPDKPAEFLNYEKTVQFVKEHTKSGESIFVGSSRHDRVCSADPLFYFLTDRPSAVYDYEMHRGYFNTPEAQQRAISEIEKKSVRYVVLREILDAQCVETNDSVKISGPSILDEYLHRHYKLTTSFGSEHIYESL